MRTHQSFQRETGNNRKLAVHFETVWLCLCYAEGPPWSALDASLCLQPMAKTEAVSQLPAENALLKFFTFVCFCSRRQAFNSSVVDFSATQNSADGLSVCWDLDKSACGLCSKKHQFSLPEVCIISCTLKSEAQCFISDESFLCWVFN